MSNTFFQERVDPFDAKPNGAIIKMEHVGRYLFAKDIMKQNKITVGFDVGTGTGYGKSMMQTNATTIYGFDKEVYSANTYKINFETQDIRKIVSENSLPLPGCVVCFETLEHLKDPLSFLNQLFALLPKKGLLLISVPNGTFEPKRKGKSRDRFHRQIFFQNDLILLLKRSGFTIVEWRWQPMPLFIYHRLKFLVPFFDLIAGSNKKILLLVSRLLSYPIKSPKTYSYSMIVLCQKK